MSPDFSILRCLRRLRLRWCMGWLLLAMLAQVRAQTAPPPVLERQVMAAYLLKFASFVEWPDTSFARPDSVLLIGVAGSEALAEQLERMAAGRSVNGHPLKVRRVTASAPTGDLHMLFIDSAMDRGALAALLGAAHGRSLLTVSDAPDSDASGCMINFVVAEYKLRVDVLLRHVGPSGLRISARMLAVAHRVQGAT